MMIIVHLKKILKRRISDEIRDSMEGNMTSQEMTKALNEDMKGTCCLLFMKLQAV